MPDDVHSPGRWAARLSIIAAFVCFTLNCTFNQLTAQAAVGEGLLLAQIIGWLSMAIVLAGVALGAYGLYSGGRLRTQTAGIAIIGLVLNLGIVFVTVWAVWVLRGTAGR